MSIIEMINKEKSIKNDKSSPKWNAQFTTLFHSPELNNKIILIVLMDVYREHM